MWGERQNYGAPIDANGPIIPVESMNKFVILIFYFDLDFKVIFDLNGVAKYSKRIFPSNIIVFFFFLCGGSLNSGNTWSLGFWKFLDTIIPLIDILLLEDINVTRFMR